MYIIEDSRHLVVVAILRLFPDQLLAIIVGTNDV